MGNFDYRAGATLRVTIAQRTVFSALTGVVLALAASTSVFAQQVEENPAPIVTGIERDGLPNPALDVSEDATPFGVDLNTITVMQKGEALQDSALQAQLVPYIGKPLSNKLVAEIRAAVTRYFRSIDRPLVSVSVPPQEVSAGALQLDVLTFAVAEKKAEGNRWTPDTYIQKNVRLAAGDEVDGVRLIENLNWLNLNPYRNLSVVFEPGDKSGTTNLILRSDEKKPWTVWGGYHNYGSSPTDQNRVFAGVNVANFPGIDQQLSYQLTTSPQLIPSGRLFNLGHEPGYVSHSLSTFAPVTFGNGSRHKLSSQLSYVQNYSALTAPFTQDTKTLQFYGEHAFSPIKIGEFSPEFYSGIDYKRQDNEVFFNNISTASTGIDIAQLVLGVRGDFETPFGIARKGKARFDVRFVGSPGNLYARNSNAAFNAASSGRSVSSSYMYLYGSLKHDMPLPSRMFLSNSLSFQIADRALPSLEQFSLGGENTVRGYFSNEVSGDHGIALQNTFYLPSFDLGGSAGKSDGQLQPFLFADIGWAKDIAAGTSNTLASVGAGVNVSFARNLSASLSFSHILMDGTKSMQNDHRLFARVTAKY